jgi:HEAT repeat protein
MLRAAAAPERFLTRGLARFASSVARRDRRRAVARDARDARTAFSVELPRELVQLFRAGGSRPLGDFVPAFPAVTQSTFDALLAAARRKHPSTSRARLCAYLAGTVPFGATRGGELWLYVLGAATTPSRGVVATLDPAVLAAPRLLFRGASSFALACALEESAAAGEDASRIDGARALLAAPGVAEQEGVRAAFERATALLDLLTASDAAVRRAAKKLAPRPFEPPHPPTRPQTVAARRAAKATRATRDAIPPSSATRMLLATGERVDPLALGSLVEAFFRKEGPELDAIVSAQLASRDAIVRQAALLLTEALVTTKKPRTAAARELARRRAMALRAARAEAAPESTSPRRGSAELTRRIIDIIDGLRPATDPLATTEPREEALRALSEVGDRSAVPGLVARAVTGDVGAVDMLAALGDPSAVAPLVGLLHREPQRYRLLEAAVVRALAALDAGSTSHALRTLLADNPMPSWREGIERGVLVKELVSALGALRDESAGPALLEVLSSTSQEYRAILPLAAWALGRIHHLPALATLERLLSSPKEPPTCEAIWAVGAIGAVHEDGRARAGALLGRLSGLEPGAEMVRLTALSKVRPHPGSADAPRTADLRIALERALWEPAFRQEETSRRRTWALRSLEELAAARGPRGARAAVAAHGQKPRASAKTDDLDPYFLGHEAVRYFVTRDAHALRRAAEEAFAAWSIPVPATRRYYVFEVADLERRGGLVALHEALRDPLGIFRHNVATRLAERADPSSVRPLAEATARLFAEPPTSTYEYDDAPSHLVAFVRALAKMNRPEGNDVLIEGLRGGNHQVRAVVAENAPDDERFVPELMAMLGDPRSFLRSRAERSLASLSAGNAAPESRRGSDAPPRRAPL